MAEDAVWHCVGCGVALDPGHLDAWCHVCLDVLRQRLADQLCDKQ